MFHCLGFALGAEADFRFKAIDAKWSLAGLDVWSLGITVYMMLYDESPFCRESAFETYRAIVNEEPKVKRLKALNDYQVPEDCSNLQLMQFYQRRLISPELKDLLKKMLEKQPTKRCSALDVMVNCYWCHNSTQCLTAYTADPSLDSINRYFCKRTQAK